MNEKERIKKVERALSATERSFAVLTKLPFVVMKAIITSTALCAGWSLIWAFPMKIAWNFVIPAIFGLPTIGYWQMFCLMFLVVDLWKITPIIIDTGKMKVG